MVMNAKGKTNMAFPPEAAAIIADVEARTAALMQALGSVAGTQNIDRILRLPGTTNLPNKTKIKKGRVVCPTSLAQFNGATCKLEDSPPATSTKDAPGAGAETEIDWTKVEERAGWLKNVADLLMDFNTKGKMIIAHKGSIKDLSIDLKRAGLVEKNYSSWSDVTLALASIFKADGRFTNEQIAAALMCNLECNRHVAKLDGAQKRRAIDRALDRSYEPLKKRVARALNWRECNADGMPLPSMHNARLAITALGIECSYDLHNKMLFGFRGDTVQHEIQSILGEMTDYGILSLRQIMSDRFGFDLGDKATRDAVISLALGHCFNPVLDMLDKAEADWDGVERLDKMAVDYFNCADTPLNRAIIRKTMIAAVRRVRQPGCKFDTITVLESEEGLNKSSAWAVIAGAENFSDVGILGHNAREVQEQLAEVWIHENADGSANRRFCLAVDELDGDPHAIRCLAHASFRNIVHAEFTRDLLRLHGLALMHENGVAGNDQEFAETRQLGNDVLGQPVGKELLLRITAHIDERQHRDRRLPRAHLGRCLAARDSVARLRRLVVQ
jgi:Virulence-associated protein E